MGAADDFLENPGFGRPIAPIEEVVGAWEAERKVVPDSDVEGMATMLAVLGVDAMTGDGLLNQIPPDVLDAFSHLEGAKADTYEQVRAILADKLS